MPISLLLDRRILYKRSKSSALASAWGSSFPTYLISAVKSAARAAVVHSRLGKLSKSAIRELISVGLKDWASSEL